MPAVNRVCMKTCEQCQISPTSLSRTPVKGVLSSWSTWGDCSAECGEGTTRRTRSCVPIRVDDEPIFCDGPPAEEKSCVVKSCSGNLLCDQLRDAPIRWPID